MQLCSVSQAQRILGNGAVWAWSEAVTAIEMDLVW